MSKFLLAVIFVHTLFAFDWDSKHECTLSKDQLEKIEITNLEDKTKSILNFRWTLYKNKRLVVLLKKDNFPNQYILEQSYKANSIKINLSDDYTDEYNRAYIRISFRDFKEHKAKFKIFLRDPKRRFSVKYIDPKK